MSETPFDLQLQNQEQENREYEDYKANGGRLDELSWVMAGKPNSIPKRAVPRIEDGNSKEGWQHIDERHVTGDSPKGAGDLFAEGTTREQLSEAAKEVVKSGNLISSPSRRIKTYEKRIKVNGQRDRVRAIVDSQDTNRVISIFPVRSE